MVLIIDYPSFIPLISSDCCSSRILLILISSFCIAPASYLNSCYSSSPLFSGEIAGDSIASVPKIASTISSPVAMADYSSAVVTGEKIASTISSPVGASGYYTGEKMASTISSPVGAAGYSSGEKMASTISSPVGSGCSCAAVAGSRLIKSSSGLFSYGRSIRGASPSAATASYMISTRGASFSFIFVNKNFF